MEESAHRSEVRASLVKLGYDRCAYTDKDDNNCYTETWSNGYDTIVLRWGRK